MVLDRREAGAAGRQTLRHFWVVELEPNDERRGLDGCRSDGEAAHLRLPGRDRLQHRLRLARIDDPGKELERNLDRLARGDLPRVDLWDFRAEDGVGRVDESPPPD